MAAAKLVEGAHHQGLADFREHLGGELTLTLLEGIGRGVEITSVSEEAILRALSWLRRRRPVG